MGSAVSVTAANGVARAPRPSSLADVLDLVLDKGLVVDAYVRVSLVGIELLTVDARIVIASVDTYLHYAEAVNRLDLRPKEVEGIPGFLGQGEGDDGERHSNGSGGHRSEGGRPGGQQFVGRARHEPQEGEAEPEQGEDGRRSLASRIGERGRRD